MLAAARVAALACEDVHPPILSEPVTRLAVADADDANILKISFDPRGVRTIEPAGDEANGWIDAEDPTGAWHYREWQWWKGHPWGESCRPRFFADVKFRALPNPSRGAEIAYRIDGFDCRQIFFVPDMADADEPYWDVMTTIRNVLGRDVEEYGHFFACYTRMNDHRSFWYWDESDKLVRFADRGVGHLDGYIAPPGAYFAKQGAVPHCPRGGGKIVGRWRWPVMVSHTSAAGWRSVVMIEARYAAALTQGIEGKAMDYILFPGPDRRTFADGAEFSVHIRHTLLKSRELPTIERLEELWQTFEASHAEVRERAGRL
jgi:hypothetical protein